MFHLKHNDRTVVVVLIYCSIFILFFKSQHFTSLPGVSNMLFFVCVCVCVCVCAVTVKRRRCVITVVIVSHVIVIHRYRHSSIVVAAVNKEFLIKARRFSDSANFRFRCFVPI